MSVLSKRPASGQTAAANRAGILDATVSLLERGAAFAELSVGAIASEAAVSRPTFYAYFNDKRDLILALGERFETRTHSAADTWLALGNDDLASTLTSVLSAFRDDHATMRAIVEAATYDVAVAEFWRTFHARFIQAVIQRAGPAGAERSEEDVRADAFSLIWMTQRTLAEHLVAPQVSDGALIASLVRLWRSVLPVVSPDA